MFFGWGFLFFTLTWCMGSGVLARGKWVRNGSGAGAEEKGERGEKRDPRRRPPPSQHDLKYFRTCWVVPQPLWHASPSPPLFPLPLRSGCADPQRPSLKELAERCLVVVWQQGGLLLGGWEEGRGGRGKGEGERQGGLKANCPVYAAGARSRQRVADRASAELRLIMCHSGRGSRAANAIRDSAPVLLALLPQELHLHVKSIP